MSKTEWGVKRRCAKCDVPFYDMLRYPIRCPKCGSAFRLDAPRARRAAVKQAAKVARTPRASSKAALPTVDSGPGETETRSYRASDVVDDIDRDEDEDELDDDVAADDDEPDDDVDGATPDKAGSAAREH